MTEILESGDIAFFYRPRVEEEDPHGLEDVQRISMALRPHDRRGWRLLVVGRKQLPDPSSPGEERYWAFVDDAGDDVAGLQQHLAAEDRPSRTRGQRHQPAARPAGEGVYVITRHDGHTHLAYELELPGEPGEVQRELGIEPQASYVVSVKKPEAPNPPQAGLSPRRQAEFPDDLQERFRGRRWIDLDPAAFLDHPGAEVLLVAAAPDPADEMGVDLPAERETSESADVFTEMGLHRDANPLEPLFTGHWD